MNWTPKSWTPLRIAVLVAAAIGTLFWLGSLVQWWMIPRTSRDGFELMGVALSTAFFVVLVLPTLVLGLIARACLRRRARRHRRRAGDGYGLALAALVVKSRRA